MSKAKSSKTLPRVLQRITHALKESRLMSWGKDVGGPYPWRKK